MKRLRLTSCFPPQRAGFDSKTAHIEFVVDKMVLKSALKRTVGKVIARFLKYYSILGCKALNFNARIFTQESHKKP